MFQYRKRRRLVQQVAHGRNASEWIPDRWLPSPSTKDRLENLPDVKFAFSMSSFSRTIVDGDACQVRYVILAKVHDVVDTLFDSLLRALFHVLLRILHS